MKGFRSTMWVDAFSPADRAAVEQIARAGGQALDLDAELGRAWARISVARATPGGTALGFLLVWRAADELHVINVATDPSAQRRGVARALLVDALSRAAREGARLAVLEVRRSNRAAIALYRSQGFTVASVRRGYYADNGEDAVEMMAAIDPATGQVLPGRDEYPLGEG